MTSRDLSAGQLRYHLQELSVAVARRLVAVLDAARDAPHGVAAELDAVVAEITDIQRDLAYEMAGPPIGGAADLTSLSRMLDLQRRMMRLMDRLETISSRPITNYLEQRQRTPLEAAAIADGRRRGLSSLTHYDGAAAPTMRFPRCANWEQPHQIPVPGLRRSQPARGVRCACRRDGAVSGSCARLQRQCRHDRHGTLAAFFAGGAVGNFAHGDLHRLGSADNHRQSPDARRTLRASCSTPKTWRSAATGSTLTWRSDELATAAPERSATRLGRDATHCDSASRRAAGNDHCLAAARPNQTEGSTPQPRCAVGGRSRDASGSLGCTAGVRQAEGALSRTFSARRRRRSRPYRRKTARPGTGCRSFLRFRGARPRTSASVCEQPAMWDAGSGRARVSRRGGAENFTSSRPVARPKSRQPSGFFRVAG